MVDVVQAIARSLYEARSCPGTWESPDKFWRGDCIRVAERIASDINDFLKTEV